MKMMSLFGLLNLDTSIDDFMVDLRDAMPSNVSFIDYTFDVPYKNKLYRLVQKYSIDGILPPCFVDCNQKHPEFVLKSIRYIKQYEKSVIKRSNIPHDRGYACPTGTYYLKFSVYFDKV